MGLMRFALGFLFFSHMVLPFAAAGDIDSVADTEALGGSYAVQTAATLDLKGPRELSRFLAESVNHGDVPGVVVLVTALDRIR